MSTVATETLAVVHEKDPKLVITDALKGLLDKIRVTGSDVLVCVYERPTQLAGSKLYLPETSSRISEDKFQGVIGLIVQTGPNYHKHKEAIGLDPTPKVGDWILFNTGDCQSFVMGKRAMRLLQGNYIRAVVTDPDVII